jgi:hypothetical protein
MIIGFRSMTIPQATTDRQGVYIHKAYPQMTSRRGNEELLFSLIEAGWYADAERATRAEEEFDKRVEEEMKRARK